MRTCLIITLLSVVACHYAAPTGDQDCSNIRYLPFNLKERVCGSDGNTYVSREHLQFENCVRGTDMTVVREGWCDQELEEEELIKDVIWHFAADLIRDFKQEMQGSGTGSIFEFINSLSSSSEEATSHETEEVEAKKKK